MPRRPRVFVAGAAYHVYCRVARGEAAFSYPREAGALVAVIRDVVREHGLSVLAWCVMGTHYHMAVRMVIPIRYLVSPSHLIAVGLGSFR